MRFRVQLEAFSGPLDLLWYLIRKHEMDVMDISIAKVAEQYLQLMEVVEAIDMNAAGDFLEVATRLMEAKSRQMLPRQEDDEEETVEETHGDLVQRLLEYKKYRDAASMLEERSRQWQQRFARRDRDTDVGRVDPSQQPIQQLEIWDLVSAFSQVIKNHQSAQTSSIRYDDTPVEVYMQRIRERLEREPELVFSSLFTGEMTRSQMVGIFLAVLELIRHAQVRVEQEELFGEIIIVSTGATESAKLGVVIDDTPE